MRFFVPFFVLIISEAGVAKQDQYNDLVQFLVGKWDNVSFEVVNGLPVKREAYPETMIGKSVHTITITAHSFRDGKDLTKDMNLELIGDAVTMKQGDFVAEGKREGNVYYLKGFHGKKEFRFRLYTMGDKYVFHRETWESGLISQMDMSYLVRK